MCSDSIFPTNSLAVMHEDKNTAIAACVGFHIPIAPSLTCSVGGLVTLSSKSTLNAFLNTDFKSSFY